MSLLGALALVAGSVSGCGSERASRTPPEPTLLEQLKAKGRAPREGVAFSYHPGQPEGLVASRRLDASHTLYVGLHGERWLFGAPEEPARVSSWLVPEPLLAIHQGATGFEFLGASGAVFRATAPLGPLTERREPPLPLVRVAGGGGRVVGIDRVGGLHVSDDAGRRWRREGPQGLTFFDVAVATDGASWALAAPEALWELPAGAAEWRPLELASVGAHELRRGKDGALAAVGPLEAWVLAEAPGLWARRPPPLAGGRLQPRGRAPLGPSAEALRQGSASIVQGQYVEVRRMGEAWRWLEGAWGEPLASRALGEFEGCVAPRVAGFGDWRVVACAREEAARLSQRLALWVSSDRGQQWRRRGTVWGQLDSFRWALGAEAVVAMTGICSLGRGGEGCAPDGVYWGTMAGPQPGGASLSFEPAQIAGLRGPALGIRFGAHGRRLYAVGVRQVHQDLALYAANAARAPFEMHVLDGAGRRSEEGRASVGAGGAEPQRSAAVIASLSVGPDGTVAVLVERDGGVDWITTDAAGHPLSTSTAPTRRAAIAVYGSLGLAVEPHTGALWESTDAGTHWGPAGNLVYPPCPGDSRCQLPLACRQFGCAIGDALSRVGWGEVEGAPRPPRPEAAESPEADSPRATRRALACVLTDATRWHPLEWAVRPPGAAEAALGEVEWYALAVERSRAAAWVYAQRTHEGAPSREVLLPPVAEAARHAMAVVRQVEGVAVLRYSTPKGTHSEPLLRDVRVSWCDLLAGDCVQSRLTRDVPHKIGDYSRGRLGVHDARPDLLTVAPGGVYLRIHSLSAAQQPTWFLDGRAARRLPRMRVPLPSTALRGEVARVGGADLPLFFTKAGGVIRGSLQGGEWQWDARGLLLPPGAPLHLAQSLDVAYVDGRAALHVVTSGALERPRARLYPLGGPGQPWPHALAVPTQAALSDPPRACSARERREWPRLVVAAERGSTREVFVSEALEPDRVLASGRAVIRGRGEAHCLAALEAKSIATGDDGREYVALVDPGRLQRAWLFRWDRRAAEAPVETRPMSCEFWAAARGGAEASPSESGADAGTTAR